MYHQMGGKSSVYADYDQLLRHVLGWTLLFCCPALPAVMREYVWADMETVSPTSTLTAWLSSASTGSAWTTATSSSGSAALLSGSLTSASTRTW